MSAANDGKSRYERLPPAAKAEIQRLLARQKMYLEENEKIRIFINQTQRQIELLEGNLRNVIQAERLLAMGEEGVRTRGAPENYARIAGATEILARFDKDALVTEYRSQKAHLASLEEKITTHNAFIAQIKAEAKAILTTAHGGQRRTRAHRKGRHLTRKHRS